jgi:hypothetical protein
MDRLARAFVLIPGKEEAFQAFAQEVRRRRAETDAFYRSYGIVRESWHLQKTAAGNVVICCTDLADVRSAAPAYAASDASFDKWFKQNVRELFGVDPDTQPRGPESTTVLDWRAAKEATRDRAAASKPRAAGRASG